MVFKRPIRWLLSKVWAVLDWFLHFTSNYPVFVKKHRLLTFVVGIVTVSLYAIMIPITILCEWLGIDGPDVKEDE